MHLMCMQTALRVHENSCMLLVPLCKNNFNLLISHTDQYALRKQEQALPKRFKFPTQQSQILLAIVHHSIHNLLQPLSLGFL